MSKNKRQGGFPFTELMIIVVIIGILAALAIPRFMEAVKKNQSSKVVSDEEYIQKLGIEKCREIAQAWNAYYDWYGYRTYNIHDLENIPGYPFELRLDSVYRYSLINDDWCWGILGCDHNQPTVQMTGNLDADPALDKVQILAVGDSMYVKYEFNDLEYFTR